MNAFTAQKKIQQMRQEVETMIGYAYGQDGLEEYKETLRKVRKQRQDTAYRKAEFMESLIAWFVGTVALLCAVGILVVVIYFIGRSQGKW